MKKIMNIKTISLLAITSFSFAQEKIQNGGFETTTAKVNTYHQIGLSGNWSNANSGTVDLFTKSTCKSTVGVPVNYMGKQEAFDGSSYAGLIAFWDDNLGSMEMASNSVLKTEFTPYKSYSEYLTQQLSNTLESGKTYKIKLMVNLSDNSARAVSNLGAVISSTEIKSDKNSFIKNITPTIFSNEILKDKDGWMEISGNYIAKGDEKFITIGVFGDFKSEKVIPNFTNDSRKAYYYIDGVSVTEVANTDKDKDGIVDSEDKCPDVFGKKEFKGCLDSDNDGIADYEDKCPTVFGSKDFIGCPDTDKDGIADSEDKCPTLFGTSEMFGCPDTDKDGLADNLDKCPNSAGVAANGGCPEISDKTKEVFAQALTGVQFESGKDVIKPISFNILNNVAGIMKENKDYSLSIHGYTDSQGDDRKNEDLSKRRAKAVAKYLTAKGVQPYRLSPDGFGEANPVADNLTPQGRAKNRRVEFKVQ